MSLQLTYRVGLGHAELATTDAKWVFDKDSFEVVATSRTVGLTEMLRKAEGGQSLLVKLMAAGTCQSGCRFPAFPVGATGKRKARGHQM